MSGPSLTPAAAAAQAMCRVHLHRCRCASQGKGAHCEYREREVRTVLSATGMTDDEVGKIMEGPVRVHRDGRAKSENDA